MKVKIKRIDTTLPLPSYHTAGAVAFDLYARTTTSIPPRETARIPANLVVAIPDGYMLLVKDRSSTLKRTGLLVTVGYVDRDYCGESDELLLQAYNLTDHPVTVERGERIGQAAFVRVDTAEWEEVDSMEAPSRGGFGTTGTHITQH